jgi:hypothetical protein
MMALGEILLFFKMKNVSLIDYEMLATGVV